MKKIKNFVFWTLSIIILILGILSGLASLPCGLCFVAMAILLNPKVDLKGVYKVIGTLVLLALYVFFGQSVTAPEDASTTATTAEKEKSTTTATTESTTATTEATTESKEEEPVNFLQFQTDPDNAAWYMVAMQNIGNNYINGAKWPWGFDDYTFTDFDETDNGKVMGLVKISVKGVMDKMNAVAIFTMSEDGTSSTCNYFLLGNKLYYDDGSSDEVLSNLGLPTKQ